eukprot:CAMPEP_0174873190 /NCGR_PEP_ID=MMETSP1114-20130205/74490_1 /TAXON_ID=312471 /ORGANISM="Neobodo designis, Strain CCAP 1951/1" /LENGTH=191 /DNA_ID=CAMNT_0016108501 /DNA_START=174 /DNA_END=746 /DNA_ORIENTATION=+
MSAVSLDERGRRRREVQIIERVRVRVRHRRPQRQHGGRLALETAVRGGAADASEAHGGAEAAVAVSRGVPRCRFDGRAGLRRRAVVVLAVAAARAVVRRHARFARRRNERGCVHVGGSRQAPASPKRWLGGAAPDRRNPHDGVPKLADDRGELRRRARPVGGGRDAINGGLDDAVKGRDGAHDVVLLQRQE